MVSKVCSRSQAQPVFVGPQPGHDVDQSGYVAAGAAWLRLLGCWGRGGARDFARAGAGVNAKLKAPWPCQMAGWEARNAGSSLISVRQASAIGMRVAASPVPLRTPMTRPGASAAAHVDVVAIVADDCDLRRCKIERGGKSESHAGAGLHAVAAVVTADESDVMGKAEGDPASGEWKPRYPRRRCRVSDPRRAMLRNRRRDCRSAPNRSRRR